jgi:NAD(P)H-dependent flavin oxidoreductase YrpB (nitropropane dioxygenase family)
MIVTESLPEIIQGGMGTGVSNWELAKSVAKLGQLAVVSGTAIDVILVRRLQDGDVGGHMRRALRAFPWQDMVQTILAKYYQKGGKATGYAYKPVPLPAVDMSDASAFL